MFLLRRLFFCRESIGCCLGTVSRFFKLLSTIPVAPVVTGMTKHFTFHICWISILRLFYFNFSPASVCITSLSDGTATYIKSVKLVWNQNTSKFDKELILWHFSCLLESASRSLIDTDWCFRCPNCSQHQGNYRPENRHYLLLCSCLQNR